MIVRLFIKDITLRIQLIYFSRFQALHRISPNILPKLSSILRSVGLHNLFPRLKSRELEGKSRSSLRQDFENSNLPRTHHLAILQQRPLPPTRILSILSPPSRDPVYHPLTTHTPRLRPVLKARDLDCKESEFPSTTKDRDNSCALCRNSLSKLYLIFGIASLSPLHCLPAL